MQASKDCVQKTIKRLEDKIQGNVLKQILYAMHSSQVGSAVRALCSCTVTLEQWCRSVCCMTKAVKVLPKFITAVATVLAPTMCPRLLHYGATSNISAVHTGY